MNNKACMFYVNIKNRDESEAIQRIAFSFGYGWGGVKQVVSYFEAPFLFFNPNQKIITYSFDKVFFENEVCVMCNTIEDVVRMFHYLSNSGNYVVNLDGSVLYDGKRITSEKFDELSEVRNIILGRSNDNK